MCDAPLSGFNGLLIRNRSLEGEGYEEIKSAAVFVHLGRPDGLNAGIFRQCQNRLRILPVDQVLARVGFDSQKVAVPAVA
jgi:hypothetical protein